MSRPAKQSLMVVKKDLEQIPAKINFVSGYKRLKET